jgi:hypothetical protein
MDVELGPKKLYDIVKLLDLNMPIDIRFNPSITRCTVKNLETGLTIELNKGEEVTINRLFIYMFNDYVWPGKPITKEEPNNYRVQKYRPGKKKS